MPTKQIICISLIANSSEELKIELMMDLQIFTCIMNINFIDEYVDILVIYGMVAQDNVLSWPSSLLLLIADLGPSSDIALKC